MNILPLNIVAALQGSAATDFRCGGRFYFIVFRSLSTNPNVKELLKSVHICQSYRKNKSGTFFMARSVYWIVPMVLVIIPATIRLCLYHWMSTIIWCECLLIVFCCSVHTSFMDHLILLYVTLLWRLTVLAM